MSIAKHYKPRYNAKRYIFKNKLVPIDSMLAILFAATVSGTSIQAATEHLGEMQSQLDHSMKDIMDVMEPKMERLPNPNYVRRSLKLWEPRQIRARFRQILKDQIKEMKHSKLIELIHGKFGDKGLSAAFDLTEVKYYGQDAENAKFINTSTKKGGSKYCYLYLTLQLICPGFRLIIDAEPIYEDSEPIGKIMTSMLKRARRANLKIKKLYVDRGFYQAEVLQTFNDELSRRLLMPAKRTPMVKKTIRSWYKKNGYTEGTKTVKIKSKKTGHEQKYVLVFKPKSEGERRKLREKQKREENDVNLDQIDQDFIYFCLLDPARKGKTMAEVFDQVALEYSRRWGIETGYRVSKQVWAWTTSQSFNLRYWLMWTSIVVFNLWILENLKLHDHELGKDFPGRRKSKEEILEEIQLQYNCCDIPTLEQVEGEKERRRKSKLPTEQRSTKEFPSRPWKPRPKIPIRRVSNKIMLLMLMLTRTWHDRDTILRQRLDPPMEL